MNFSDNEYLNEAVRMLLHLANSIDCSTRDGVEHLGDEMAKVCLDYDSQLNDMQMTILSEQRTELLMQAMVGLRPS